MSAPEPEMQAGDLPPEPSLDSLLQQAMDRHRAADLSEAERLYRLILSRQITHPDANHNLGLLLVTTGHAAAALPHFQTALQTNPTQRQFWLSCIDALILLSQLDAARQMLALGVQSGLNGDAVEALQNRLRTAASATSAAAPDPVSAGLVTADSAVESKPIAESAVQLAVGRLKSDRRKHGVAAKHPSPTDIDRLQSLFDQHRDIEMQALAKSIIGRYPNSGFAWNLLGAHEQRNRRFADAEGFFRRALQAEPDYADGSFNLGRMLQFNGALAEAEQCYRKAINRRARFLEAHFSLGDVLYKQSRFAEAEESLRKVIKIQPDLAVAHNSLAIMLKRQNRPQESEASCRSALALNPEFVEALCNLGAALQDQGKLAESAAHYRRALAIKDDLAVAHHGLLFCLSHGGETDPEIIFKHHLRFGACFEAPLRSAWPKHRNSVDPDRRLRVGFVSGDFRDHAMANFIEPILTSLAADPQLSLHAYSNNAVEDAVTLRLRERIPNWNKIFALSDEALATMIQENRIDILVDLSGHTSHNRLLTFARKPAPIQCGWIGYLGTSGLQSIDYYLGDKYFLPPGEFDRFFTEKIAYLSAVAPFQPSPNAPAVSPLPAFTNGRFTFASFSRISKLNPGVIALWSQLLRALPQSQMLVAAMPDDSQSQIVSRWFDAEGIAPDRIQLHKRSNLQTYFALHHQVDLCLDPFPFTGATTTGNALWMGVPTLTLAGTTIPGRLGPALLHHVELGDFVARSPEDFVAKGLYWAEHLEILAELRADMRERFLRSVISQPGAIAESLAAAFRAMWVTWCASQVNSAG